MAHEFVTLAAPTGAVTFNWAPRSCCVCAPASAATADVLAFANADAPPLVAATTWTSVSRTAPCNQIVGRKHWQLAP